MRHSGAEIIIHLLGQKGITAIAGIPGSANLPLYRALHDSSIQHILARHEQGAGFIAQGMARSTGMAAVCLATSGPGATNLLTAIADAKLDSVPIVAFTGQVSTAMLGTDAFQEIDTYGLTIPITKHNFLVRSAKELLEVVPLAFEIAENGRPGPVVIDVPKDVQIQECEFDQWPTFKVTQQSRAMSANTARRMAARINKAARPILLVGAGIIESKSENLLLQLAQKNNIPVTATLRGLGCFPPTHHLYLGMIGMHGTKYANQLIEEADLVIALGVRFDDRATGQVSEFCKKAQIIHVDIDPSEINKIKPAHESVNADVSGFLEAINPLIEVNNRLTWMRSITQKMKELRYIEVSKNDDFFHPLSIIKEVATHVPSDTIITTDVGQHQMWVAMKYPITQSRTFLTSGGLGTMGFGVPTAIGAALANPHKKVVCFTGDGSFLMNIQELATIADLRPNITILLFNNGHLGLVRQQQELFFDQKYIASKFQSTPDYTKIAQGFGLLAIDLEKSQDPLQDLTQALQSKEPIFVNVPIKYTENVFPMVPPGGANHTMIG
jgi:acetolactate synthase-1/2/3 large subunit